MDNNYLDVKKKVHMLLNLNFPGHDDENACLFIVF